MMEAFPVETPDWLAARAALTPERLALACDSRRLGFAELDDLVAATAAGLCEVGVRPGDRVAVVARNGLDFVRIVHALPRIGAILVPLHVRWTATEMAAAVCDCRAAVVLHDDTLDTDAAARAFPAARCVPSDVVGSTGRSEPQRVNLSATHSILYTSGTSGAPKGPRLTFGNHLWSAVASALNLGLRPDDRWLACLPLYHVGGLAILLRSIVYGMPVVLHDRFDPDRVNRAIDEEGVTILSVVSNMLLRMIEARGGARPYPESLRCVLVGGGPVPRGLLDACAEHRLPVAQTYGLTEAASQVTTLAPDDAAGHPGSAGKPLFATELRIADESGRPLPAGETGEILVRGPTVTPGYFERPEETRAAFRDGWLRTGDLGYVDGDGYLHVHGRREDVIVTGGENVYASEVEETLCAHPRVREAAVIGEVDARWGERVTATVCVSGSGDVTDAELVAWCREKLAPFKVPARIRFAEALPRNAAGKLLRRALRQAVDTEGA
jgi:O-succinylbenzoic acid--CoA ligase